MLWVTALEGRLDLSPNLPCDEQIEQADLQLIALVVSGLIGDVSVMSPYVLRLKVRREIAGMGMWPAIEARFANEATLVVTGIRHSPSVDEVAPKQTALIWFGRVFGEAA